MRRKSRWYIYPIILAVAGFGLFIALHDYQVPQTDVEKDIPYARLQK